MAIGGGGPHQVLGITTTLGKDAFLVLRRDTEPERIAWRTGLYRVCVDGGIFLGPFLSGVLGMRLAGILPAVSTVALALTALLLLTRARSSGTMAIHG